MTNNTQELDVILERYRLHADVAYSEVEDNFHTAEEFKTLALPNVLDEAKQAILAWRDREVASRVIEELEQIKRLSNGKFGKQIVVTGDGQIVLQQLLKIHSYSVDRIAKLKSEVEST